MAYIVLTRVTITTYEIAKVFFDVQWRHPRFPRVIVLDHDPKFRSAFWKYFFEKLKPS
jgi:hypothetical protein